MLHFSQSFTFSYVMQLGKLHCVPYITDTLGTDITLSGNMHSGGCQTILGSTILHFQTIMQCGDISLSEFIGHGSGFLLKRIVPNPASNAIEVEMQARSLVDFTLFDVLGNSRKNGSASDNLF